MEQFRQVGEVLGSLKALMVFQSDIQINQRQCCFLLDAFTLAYETIADEMRRNLRFEDRHTTWKVLEQPLKELYKIQREAEAYVRNCFENKDWWAKAIILCQNKDCVEFHIHNLLSCMPSVIEAIETAGELSSWDEDQIYSRRVAWLRKYQQEWIDPKLFKWKFGKQYLVSTEISNRIDAVWKEDRWALLDKIREKRIPRSTKYTEQLRNLLLKNLEALDDKLLPCSILFGSKDYQVRKRLGARGEYKEISWLGETFILRHIKGNVQSLIPEVSQLVSLCHPNILQYLCAFKDEEKNECFLITEMMSKDLGTHIKEFYSPRKRTPLSLTVVVDMMLQIARGMEYLHSKKIYHGELNPSNILVKARSGSSEGYVHAKITKFGLSSVTSPNQKNTNLNETESYIWYAPEVLAAQEGLRRVTDMKYTDKSDVYSFGMISFELLSGKVPFEDTHLQGEKMSRNIRAGERPLFPYHCPKFMINLTKKCWHSDPHQRPTFSSICRILRYMKRFLVMYPDQSHPDAPVPLVDYCDIESVLLKKFPSWMTNEPLPVSEIPFQMFAYQIMEKERCMSHFRDTNESGSEETSISGDDHAAIADDHLISVLDRKITVRQESNKERPSSARRSLDITTNRYPGTPKGRSLRPPQFTRSSRSLHSSPDNYICHASPRKWRTSGHASDSELS